MSEARQATIKIDYPGSVISCNHYLGRNMHGGTYVKPEARVWMTELGWMIAHLHIEDWAFPIDILCSGHFKDSRSAPDLSNLSKCTCDAIQDITGHNDKDFRWHDGNRIIGEPEPYLLITIREYSPEASQSNSTGIEKKVRVKNCRLTTAQKGSKISSKMIKNQIKGR